MLVRHQKHQIWTPDQLGGQASEEVPLALHRIEQHNNFTMPQIMAVGLNSEIFY
jgi:hypothetical protein